MLASSEWRNPNMILAKSDLNFASFQRTKIRYASKFPPEVGTIGRLISTES